MEENSVEPSCLVPDSFTDDITTHLIDNMLNSFNGKSEHLDNAIECTKITQLGCDDTELVDELPDHSCIADDEIPSVGMRKIRATNFDRMIKQPINQSIHCNREGFRGSHVKAPIRKNIMAGVGCRARIYAKFHRKKHDWVLLKVELNHSHPCSTKKALHYHENRKLTMHAKCIIEVNDEAGIRPNKTFLALANEVGGPSNLGFSEKDVRNYISSTLLSTNVSADVKEMLNYYMRMKELNPNYFYAVNLNEDNKFMSAVWVDVRCRASYEYYGDVVSFDTTESTNRSFLDLFEDRHMWVPIFFKGQLWASMRSTQRSECMHSFFGGYLNCKTSLAQFVHEFNNVLGTKEQKELEDDAADSRGLIPCSIRSAIERRFQKEYTNEMFRDFGKKADCTIRAVDEQGDSARVKVEEEILVYETTRYVMFDVHFDRSTHEIRCNCNLFESAGILCCHCLVVLSSYKVNEVPSCYVLPRWSKNIKRKHTYIKSSHDVRRSNESHNIFRGLCAHFYNVAQEFVDCDDEADMLHNVLEDARAKLADYHGRMRNNTVATEHNSIVTDPSIVFGTEDIQTPSKVTIKGHPKGKKARI
ncbi:hypothetical protein Ahy_A06g029903 [Arachis hypogaea]|uniref:SWIM-type domain-containing protein n=1 Tax=Arachis hypogaea TaxID=3818 RepID=A0A445CUJ6_ARAHY|nr:hypothetical protein Ahy_A06g029903 [Arachis hypogaea]